jgi:hypothetical protein
MTCDEVDPRLDDYVDGALAERDFQELELHLASCEACREQERLLRVLVAQAAALPRELEPGQDLWPRIAERLEPHRVLPFPSWSQALPRWLPATLAAAAAVALAIAWLARDARVHQDGRQAANAPSAEARPAALSPGAGGALAAEREYAQAASALLAALQERRERLSPETLRTVERDLQVIDKALAQIREALAQDPGSGPLNHLLVSTHQKKVRVLQRVEKLSRI